jgi:mono/diheme cytochrome c family protein
MNRAKLLMIVAAFGVALLPLGAQSNSTALQKTSDARIKTPSASESNRGERVFKQNCSRCHNPPQGIPPRITGSTLLHMRVRASLSAADEKAVLRFMHP